MTIEGGWILNLTKLIQFPVATAAAFAAGFWFVWIGYRVGWLIAAVIHHDTMNMVIEKMVK